MQTLTVSVHFSPRANFQCRLLQCPYIFLPEPTFCADSYSVRTFFSQSQLSVQTLTVSVHFSPRANFQCRLLQCPYSPRVQSHASTIARTLKIQNTGSHNVLWTQENTAHIDRNGIALLLRRLRLDVCTCSHRAATGLVSVPVSK